MGTRHKQTVIDKDGTIRIAQYGQWDGYPSGQGVEILEYLKTGNLKKYYKNLIIIPEASKNQLDQIDSQEGENWAQKYPYLSRDCGSKIHQMIEDGSVKMVSFITEEEARKWCEAFYIIDFSKNTFTSEWDDKVITYSLDKLPTEEEYIKSLENIEED